MSHAIGRALVMAVLFTSSGLTAGFAASLGATSQGIGAARISVPRCTTAALSVIPNLSGSSVASVTVGSLPAACGGGSVQVAVNNGASSSTGSAAAPAGGGSVTASLATAVAASTTMQVEVLVVGP